MSCWRIFVGAACAYSLGVLASLSSKLAYSILLASQLADRDFPRSPRETLQIRESLKTRVVRKALGIRSFSRLSRARLNGGAGSLVRTRRSCQIPDQQGKYRELLPRLGFGTEEGTRHPLQCRGFWIEFPRPLNREFLVPNRDHLSNRGICLPRSDPHHEVHQNPNRRRSP